MTTVYSDILMADGHTFFGGRFTMAFCDRGMNFTCMFHVREDGSG